jgi:hypothetical protein
MSNPAMKGGGMRRTGIFDAVEGAEHELIAGLRFDTSLKFSNLVII